MSDKIEAPFAEDELPHGLPAADAAQPQQAVPEGWKLVPITLPDSMLEKLTRNSYLHPALQQQWNDWLAAAPPAPQQADMQAMWNEAMQDPDFRKDIAQQSAEVAQTASEPAPQQAATMMCPQCGVDRFKLPCPGTADDCAMVADAHLLTPAPQQAEALTLREEFDKAFLSMNGFHTQAELTLEWDKGLSGLMFRAGASAKTGGLQFDASDMQTQHEVGFKLGQEFAAQPDAAEVRKQVREECARMADELAHVYFNPFVQGALTNLAADFRALNDKKGG